MENPGMILRRAKCNRRFEAGRMQTTGPRTAEKQPAKPQHQSNHASYTALMRRHDRVRTRHIGGQGGANDA